MGIFENRGDPGGSRTPNPQIRSLMLYPVELRGHKDLRASYLLLYTFVHQNFQTDRSQIQSAVQHAASPWLTMLYLSKTDRVLGPEISIATRSGIPLLTMFLTADLLGSWKISPS